MRRSLALEWGDWLMRVDILVSSVMRTKTDDERRGGRRREAPSPGAACGVQHGVR